MTTKILPQKIKNPYIPSESLLPAYDEIPEEFKQLLGSNNKWVRLFSDWFFGGLKSLELTPKEGIDKDKAMRHIKVAMQGWDSKHEHKQAGVAYLFSLWFEDAKWERRDKD